MRYFFCCFVCMDTPPTVCYTHGHSFSLHDPLPISAALRADRPAWSFMCFRLLAVVCLAFNLVRGATMGEWAGCEFWIFVLIAEYAATIRTLPPAETSKIAAKGSVAE